MENNYKKYAELLLKRCLNIKKGQPLLISTSIEPLDFIRELTKVALSLGVKDIYYDYNDGCIKHEHLKYLKKKDIKDNLLFNKKIFDEYTKKGAAILMLCGGSPDIMNDINHDILKYTSKLSITSRKYYKEKQLNNEIPWCIAAVATLDHAKMVFPNSKNPINDLWNAILKCV